jgi:hypothetical protein
VIDVFGITSIIADVFEGAVYVLTSISTGLIEFPESTVKSLTAELRLVTTLVEFKSEEKSRSVLSVRSEFFRTSAIEALLLVLLPLMLLLFMLLVLLLLLQLFTLLFTLLVLLPLMLLLFMLLALLLLLLLLMLLVLLLLSKFPPLALLFLFLSLLLLLLPLLLVLPFCCAGVSVDLLPDIFCV